MIGKETEDSNVSLAWSRLKCIHQRLIYLLCLKANSNISYQMHPNLTNILYLWCFRYKGSLVKHLAAEHDIESKLETNWLII